MNKEAKMMNYKILIADDEEHILKSYKSKLDRHLDITPIFTQSPLEALEIAKNNPDEFAVIMLDYSFEGSDKTGAQVAKEILELNAKQPIIICSGMENQDSAINSLRAGVVDFIKKGGDVDEIISKIRTYFKKFDETRRVLNSRNTYRASLIGNSSLIRKIGMIGQSEAMADVAKKIIRYGENKSQDTVLIRGESGTGKELIAKALHDHSPRKDKNLVAINCGAINPNLLESELFGHRKGSFTGANTDKVGKLKIAGGGTVFLDEIGDMPLSLQVKLLRFLQEGTITPVGATEPIKVNARVIAATHVDLEKAIEEGTFREDLFYRLNVLRLNILPLRERAEDIEPLILHFMEKHPQGKDKKILYKAIQYLKAHEWKGNIRELENTIAHLLSNCVSDEVTEMDLENKFFDNSPVELKDFSCDYKAMKKRLNDYVENIEREFILSKVRNEPSLRVAAESIAISKSVLHRKLKNWGYDLSGVS